MFALPAAALATRSASPGLRPPQTADHDARHALDAIYVAHHAWALRLAVQLTGDRTAAEDVVADVFVKLHRRRRTGPIDHPQAYLRRAIANQRNSWFRRAFLERRHAATAGADDRVEHPADAGIADRDAVLRALGHLTERMRAVLVLRYYEDLSVEQTALVLGITPGTVKTTAHRALARLKILLDEGARP